MAPVVTSNRMSIESSNNSSRHYSISHAISCLLDSGDLIPSIKVVALWSSGRHLASRSGNPGFESWLCQVDVESLGKALYMHFLTPLMCKKSTRL